MIHDDVEYVISSDTHMASGLKGKQVSGVSVNVRVRPIEK